MALWGTNLYIADFLQATIKVSITEHNPHTYHNILLSIERSTIVALRELSRIVGTSDPAT